MLKRALPSKTRPNATFFLRTLVLLLLLSVAHAVCSRNVDCLNGGTCNNDLGKARFCSCASGFMGTVCEQACPLLCQNGGQCDHASDEHAFVAGATDFVCDCPSQFRGVLCEEVNSLGTDSPSSSESTLSGGATAGIVFACLAGVAVVALLLVRATSKRRRANKAEAPVEGASTGAGSVTAEDEENSPCPPID